MNNSTRNNQHNSRPVRPSRSGNSTVEYGLVGGLVLIASVGLVMLLGDALNLAFTNVKNDMAKRKVKGIVNGFVQTIQEANTVKLDNGMVIEKGGIGSSFTETIQTAGGSGTTASAGDQLRNLAQRALANGEITEEQAQNLNDLANQGLRLAKMQKLIESTFAQSGNNWAAVDRTQVQFEGKSYYIGQLTSAIGWVGSGDDPNHPFIPDPKGGPEMNAFKALYQEAKDNGSLNNPEIKAIIDQLSKEIVFVSDMVEDGFSRRNPDSGDTVLEQAQDTYEKKAGNAVKSGAIITDNDSSDICSTGNGQVSGGSCQ